MIAILAAMEAEIVYLKKRMAIKKTSSEKACRIYTGEISGKECLLVLTGVGKRNAQQAAEFITEEYPIGLMISTGYAGALNGKSRVGDIVVYSGVNCQVEPPASIQKNLVSDSGLVDKAIKGTENQGFDTFLGQGVTIAQVCTTRESKYTLGQVYEADAVDMESFWISEIAGKKGLPFIAVRSISDSAQDDLSFLDHIMVKSQVRPLKALGYFVCHPAQIKIAVGLSSNFRKASKNLNEYLQRLIQSL